MKHENKFSTSWRASKRPGKQRKYSAKAPLHLRSRFMSANLSKELRQKYGKRSMPLKKGDVVRVMKGGFKKKTGKISVVNRKRRLVEIEGLQIKKQDGSKASVKFNPSILQITELNIEDQKRISTKMKTEKQEAQKNAP